MMEKRFVCKLCGERFEERDALVEYGLEEHESNEN